MSGLLSAGRDPPREIEEDVEADQPSEQTPLLGGGQQNGATDQSQPQHETSASSFLRGLSDRTSSDQSSSNKKRRWPSILALLILTIVVILIIVFAFVAPSTVEQYGQQAAVFEPTSLSIETFTSSGVVARVQGDFMMDASRVEKSSVRNLGRFGTWIASQAETGKSEVEVSLPEYGNVVLGTAKVPPIKVSLRNGHSTHVDFATDLKPGDVDGIRRIANDWIEGRLGQLRVLGKAEVPVKSGIFSIGTQALQHELLFANKDVPKIPKYKIEKLNVREAETPAGKGMAADVALLVENKYPVDFTIPPLGFGILVDNCHKKDPYIMVADAITDSLHIHPKQDVELNVTGNVRQLPDILTQACPGSHESPLDAIVGNYMHGNDTTIYVKGSDSPSPDTPRWITDLMADIVVPVSLPGRTFGSLIKNFTLADTHFSLPDPFAEPNTPDANPRISAKVKALIALPEEMNFNISVGRVRADADVFYKGKKLGKLDLHKWQQANSTRVERESKDDGPTLLVESLIEEAPLNITNEDTFTEVLQALLFGGKGITMEIKADVDVEISTALGAFAVRKIPAAGQVPIKPISSGHGGNPDNVAHAFTPHIYNLAILATSPSSLTLSALVNISNPTPYSATIPYATIHILVNATTVANATVRNLSLKPGNNTALPVTAVWDPLANSGQMGKAVGAEMLSQYISGYNTTLTLQVHENSIPALPALGRALSNFPVTFPTPSLHPPPSSDNPSDPDDPDDDDDDHQGTRFIQSATFHLLTSTASFVLRSPLKTNTLYITHLNATAYYHDDPVGKILYDLPFAIPPVGEDGEGSESPRLPVQWSLGSVGYRAVKGALGGRLRLAAFARVGVRVGEWEEGVWFRGRGLGARVRL